MTTNTSPAPIGADALRMVLQDMRHPAYPPYVNQFADAIEAALASPAAQVDAPTDSGPISRKWLTVVYQDVAAGDEARALCLHPKASAMSWSHAIRDRDAARAAKEGGA